MEATGMPLSEVAGDASSSSAMPTGGGIFGGGLPTAAPQMQLLDFFFPGFSVFSGAVQRYLHVDLNLYIPLVLLCGGLTFVWQYFSEYFWGITESHLMSVVDIRTDDEIYNMLMAWVAAQRFARSARRFVVNTNLNSRAWFLWRWEDDDENDESEEDEGATGGKKKKALAYTPTFGSHWFWYKGHLLIFRRTQNREQASFLVASEREEISISCFGRDPRILKQLLHEAREQYMKRDAAKTLIYRGATKSGSTEPTWQRCMARTSRPFSTVILNEKVKKDLIDDVTDYLNPATRRWYSNRGIPYRRGYLLFGPPGTGKSSLSLALAGFFKMRIYIVSLSSVTASEENLASLFAELPRRCVVLLEDIDTAGLTHTRDENGKEVANTYGNNNVNNSGGDMVPGQLTPGNGVANVGRLSLSGLLNILDGVASQEGRVLIMTTNHLEKLDKALIRPGRVDMIVKFDRADQEMTAAIFRAIFAPLEGDEEQIAVNPNEKVVPLTPEQEKKAAEEAAEAARKNEEITARVSVLAEKFAQKIPAHEFSPAELQGYLLKNKRNPDKAVEGAEEWVVETRKEKKEKELKEAQEKRDAEEKKKKEEEEKKKKEEEEKKKKEEEEKQKEEKEKKKKSKKEKRKNKRSKRKSNSDDDSSSGSDSEEDSESEKDKEQKKSKKERSNTNATTTGEAPKVLAESKTTEIPTISVEHVEDKKDEVKVLDEEVKHGGDSGYGTP